MTKRDDAKGKLLARREALATLGTLTTLGAVAPLFLLGCGSSTDTGDGSSGSDASTGTDAASASDAASSGDAGTCAEIPDETGGPYPDVDGMISSTTYQRSDITEGKAGTPLTVTLQVVDVGNACAPVVGARVIVWQCDADGVYSEYATTMNSDSAQGEEGSTSTTYLRGWQVTDSDGKVTFTTIYPGWYTPRVTSSLYPKGQNTTTDATDMVFGASDAYLVATVTGDTTSGYVATLPVGLASY